MKDESQVDFDYFTRVDFDLNFNEIVEILGRIEDREDETDTPQGEEPTVRSYRFEVSPNKDEETGFRDIELHPLAEVEEVDEDRDFLDTKLSISYEFPEGYDREYEDDTYIVRLWSDGFEIFTNEAYLRTGATQIFHVLKEELEKGPN